MQMSKLISRRLTASEFEDELGSLFREIFSYAGCKLETFRKSDWRTVLVPYGCNMAQSDRQGLVSAIVTCGDQEVVIRDVESLSPSVAAIVVPTSSNALAALAGTDFAIMDTHWFGQSKRWGCVNAASLDDILIVGGDAEFIRSFTEAVGGVEALRDRFVRFSKTEWSIEHEIRQKILGLPDW